MVGVGQVTVLPEQSRYLFSARAEKAGDRQWQTRRKPWTQSYGSKASKAKIAEPPKPFEERHVGPLPGRMAFFRSPLRIGHNESKRRVIEEPGRLVMRDISTWP
jgi:hypothetical protein